MRVSPPMVPMVLLVACTMVRDPNERFDGGAGSDAPVGADVPGGCAAPRMMCGPTCANPRLDSVNCGACGTRCAMGQRCDMGRCVAVSLPSCPAPERGCDVVWVTGGTFAMGEAGTLGAEPVQPSITVGDFEVDATEVTVRRFRRWWSAGHNRLPPPTYPSGAMPMPTGSEVEPVATTTNMHCNWSPAAGAREEHPINCVDWNTALAFCVWDGGRLPTEAEWEYVARARPAPEAMAPRRYPWGDLEPALSGACDRAQWRGCAGDNGGITRVVGSFLNGSIGGVADLAGNVGEWTADVAAPYNDPGCWNGTARANPLCTAGGGNRVARGVPYYAMGGAAADAQSLRVAAREAMGAPAAEGMRPQVGFRCVRDRR